MNWCHVIRAQGGCITYEHDDDDDDTYIHTYEEMEMVDAAEEAAPAPRVTRALAATLGCELAEMTDADMADDEPPSPVAPTLTPASADPAPTRQTRS